ncbi:MAG TPA: hypothetical protein VGF13_02290 [Verrucomicrobiae bacterium]|jgi:hypothetical protein
MARWNSANVLQLAKDQKRLWQFNIRGDNPHLAREEKKLPTEALPARLISKDWQTLYQPKLNVAWLPADKVFLRVLQLPPADTIEETAAMVELQLEKVSPLPVAQIGWTFELLPRREGQAQTAIVVIAARNVVEEFLGKLEGESYLADRLEVPFLDQLLATKVDADGVWVFPGVGSDDSNCLVAWWYGGVLQNVSLLHLSLTEERGQFLRDQISQMAWAGELEGWITAPPRRFLVADAELATVWQPLLQEGIEQQVEVVPPLPASEIAKLTAKRATRDKAPVGLVPAEFTARYRQQFVDRIWMRSAFAVAIFYLFGVFIYLAFVQYKEFEVGKIEDQARQLAPSYTNALRLKDQVRVLQDQLNLQFAALDSYKAVAEKIPDGIQLEGMSFNRGKTLSIFGTAPGDAGTKINAFYESLRGATVNGEPLFKPSGQPPPLARRGTDWSWTMSFELMKGEGD